MKRHALRRWVTACLFGASCVPGCLQAGGQGTAGMAPEEPGGLLYRRPQAVRPAVVSPYLPATVVQTSANVPAVASSQTGPWPPAHLVVAAPPGPDVVSPAAEDPPREPGPVPAAVVQENDVFVLPPLTVPPPGLAPDSTGGVIVPVKSSVGPDPQGNGSGVRDLLQKTPARPALQFQESAGPAPPPAPPPTKISWSEPHSVFPRGEPDSVRRSYVDLSAAPCFSHAADYSWIDGQVEYSRIGKEWRLRYASVDESDRYGGRVLLIENHHVGLLADGQYVHVEGHLVNPDAESGPVSYRIEAFRTIQNPNTPGSSPAQAP